MTPTYWFWPAWFVVSVFASFGIAKVLIHIMDWLDERW